MQDLCNALLKYNELPNHYLKKNISNLNFSEYTDHCPKSVTSQFHTLKYGVEYVGTINASKIRIRFFTKMKDD